MSMHTVYVLMRGQQVIDMSRYLDPQKAIDEWYFADRPSEVWACRISETAAQEVREALYPESQPHNVWAGNTSYKRKTTDPLKLLKTYSHSMTKVHDLV